MHKLRFKQTYLNGGKIFCKAMMIRLLGKRMPIFSTLYLTDKCNLRCTHCGIHTVNHKPDLFTTEEWLKIIDDLSSIGTEWYRFLGGEPLLRKDIKYLIDYVVLKKGKIAEIVTNGIDLDKKMELIQNLQFVGISLEGNRECNDLVRGKGTFEKIVKAVDACVKADKYVRVHMVLNQYNIKDENIQFMIDFCREYNIKFDFCRLMINPYITETGIPDYYYIPDSQAREFYKKILQRKITENIPVANSTLALKTLIEWPFSYDKYTLNKAETIDLPKNYKLPECTSGISTFELSNDGKMRLCVNKYAKEIDIKEAGGVKKSWEMLAGKKDCFSCSHLSVIEQSLMFNLDFYSIANVAKLLLSQ